MKRTIVASILGLVASSALVASSYGQGQINFANYAFGTGGLVSAPVTYEIGGAAVDSTFTAQLYFSLNSGATWTLATGSDAAFINASGGLFANPNVVLIPGYVSGPVQMYVTASGPGNYSGQSAVFTLPSLAAVGSPTPVGDLFNTSAPLPTPAGTYLLPFTVSAVPEPSSIALAGLGAASLLFLRRKKA